MRMKFGFKRNCSLSNKLKNINHKCSEKAISSIPCKLSLQQRRERNGSIQMLLLKYAENLVGIVVQLLNHNAKGR